MEDNKSLSTDVAKAPVTLGIISVSDDTSLPCYIIHFDSGYRSFSEFFGYLIGIKLEFMKADNGGYYFCVSSDKRMLRIKRSEFNRHLLDPLGFAELVKKIVTEGLTEFRSTFLASNEAGSRFVECLSANDGNWVLVTLASEATLVFVNKKGIIIGRYAISRELFEAITP